MCVCTLFGHLARSIGGDRFGHRRRTRVSHEAPVPFVFAHRAFSICRNPEPLRVPELPFVCARCHPPPNAKGMDRAAAFPVARNLFERRSYRVTCHNTSTREWVFVLFQVPCVVALFMVFVCLFLYVGFFICSFVCLFV